MMLSSMPVTEPGMDNLPEWVWVFVVAYLFIIVIAWVWSVVAYILQSLGLYTIAERRGIRRAWLSWIPMINYWVLGSISDQYQYLTKGKIKNRRKTLLALTILGIVAYIACMVGTLITAISGGDTPSVGGVLMMVFGMLAILAVAIAACIISYMCYYDLFCSCQPGNAVLYLVLSILLTPTLPILLFISRKKDLGMPKRKDSNAQPAQVQIQEEVSAVEEIKKETVEIKEEPVEDEPQEQPPVAEGYANPEEFADEEKP